MDEKDQKQPAAEQNPEQKAAQRAKPERSRNALLRYLTILFAFAFLLVLLSYLIQMRNMNTTVSELNKTSSNALSNAEALQATNQSLMEEKAALEDQIDALEDQIDALNDQVESEKAGASEAAETSQSRIEELETALRAQQQTYDDTLAAYESLTKAAAAWDSGDVAALREAVGELSGKTEFLSESGAALYEALSDAATASTAETGAQ